MQQIYHLISAQSTILRKYCTEYGVILRNLTIRLHEAGLINQRGCLVNLKKLNKKSNKVSPILFIWSIQHLSSILLYKRAQTTENNLHPCLQQQGPQCTHFYLQP